MTRTDRILHAADRMADAIREIDKPLGIHTMHLRIRAAIKAADSYDQAMSDPEAEATDEPAMCSRCKHEISEGHDRG